jgi:hypothetical protein
MAIGSTSGYGFGRTSSAWEVHEAWRARRRDAAANYLAVGSAAMSSFTTAASNQFQGSVAITTNVAVTRIRAAQTAAVKARLSV